MSKDFNHYMSKSAITRAIVEGVPGTALCGEVFTPESHGKRSKTGSGADSEALEVCPECELFYGGLRADAEKEVKEPTHV